MSSEPGDWNDRWDTSQSENAVWCTSAGVLVFTDLGGVCMLCIGKSATRRSSLAPAPELHQAVLSCESEL